MSGDGGDELFCGYGTYQSITNAWNKIRKIPQPVRSAAGYFLTDGPFSKKETNQIRGMLLSAHNAEELYARSDLSEPFLGKIAKERGSARSIFETYESGYLADVQHNLMLMDLLMYHPDDILVRWIGRQWQSHWKAVCRCWTRTLWSLHGVCRCG